MSQTTTKFNESGYKEADQLLARHNCSYGAIPHGVAFDFLKNVPESSYSAFISSIHLPLLAGRAASLGQKEFDTLQKTSEYENLVRKRLYDILNLPLMNFVNKHDITLCFQTLISLLSNAPRSLPHRLTLIDTSFWTNGPSIRKLLEKDHSAYATFILYLCESTTGLNITPERSSENKAVNKTHITAHHLVGTTFIITPPTRDDGYSLPLALLQNGEAYACIPENLAHIREIYPGIDFIIAKYTPPPDVKQQTLSVELSDCKPK